MQHIPLNPGHLIYHPQALKPSGTIFKTLYEALPWRQDSIQIMGRSVAIPRLQSWHGDPKAQYQYSGLKLKPAPWTPALIQLKALAESMAGAVFNSVLANLYRTGQDSNSWHSDDEPELGPQPVIASLSLGAERIFKLRPKNKHERHKTFSITLTDGSLLIMSREVQPHWQHCLPKTTRAVKPRINLTFRYVFSQNKLG